MLGRIVLEDLSLPELRRLFPEERLEVFCGSTPKTALALFEMVQID